jgi:hypothetical protein
MFIRLSALCAAVWLASLAIASAAPQISEFLAVNDSVLADGDGEFTDWIELHNPDAASIDLGGYFLSDDATDLARWQFPPTSMISSGGYLIVFASNKAVPPAGELHANFKLSGGGEFLALVEPDGETVVHSYAPHFPQQFADTTYGLANGGSEKYFTTPTPGAPNLGGIADPHADVQFTPAGGTYSGSVIVTLSNANPAAAIHFTTDGSDPNAGSPSFSAPISLSATTQVRALVIAPGDDPGPINSASYIRLAADVQSFTSPLPIVVLENFSAGNIPDKRAHNPPAGDGGGITQVARQPALMTLIDRDLSGTAEITDPATIASRIGIRVRGSSSASQPAKHENYSIETWGAIDDDEIDIQPFAMPADDDWILYAPYNYDRALIRNTLIYELVRRMGHYASRTQFVEVFINTNGGDLTMSDYSGVYVFMEKIKKSNDRVDIDDFSTDGAAGGWLLESNRKDPLPEDGSSTPPFNFHTAGPNRIQQGPYGGSSGADQGGDDIPTGYNTFLNFVSPSGYDTTLAQRGSITGWFDTFEDALYGSDFRRPDIGYRAYLDLDSFIDHYLMVNLARSVDGLQLSTFLYRPNTNGKLHLNPPWDFDRAMDSYDGRDNSTSGMWGQQFLWFPRLFSDPEFNQNFIDRWQELRQTTLSTSSIHTLIDEMAAEITEPVAAANFARWNASNNLPRSGGWPAEINHLKTWLATRLDWIDGQFLSLPTFSESGSQVSLAATDPGTIYFTLDGSDPRLPDLPGVEIELVPEVTPAVGFIPTSDIGDAWKGGSEPFDDSAWISGNSGIGFDYPALVGIDVTAMRGNVGSSYMRIPFNIDSSTLATLSSLTLNMKYEDGFAAYINGIEVASDNQPDPLTWDSATGVSRSDTLAASFEPFDISSNLGALHAGTNVLAIQAMNSSFSNGDLLALPELVANTGSTGGESPQAQVYTGTINLAAATKIVARLENGGEWSGPVDATFLFGTVPADASNLVISEIMYRPGDASMSEILAGITDRDEFEFVELLNISPTETIDLSGVKLTEVDVSGDLQGITFDFATADIQFLAPGARLVLVENREAFSLRYGPGRPIAGQFSGALSNDGERLTLLDQMDTPIREFSYNDQLPWPTAADGDGYSLVLIAPATNPDHANPFNWIPSSAINGTPGTANTRSYVGTPNDDLDSDGLDSLVEYVLGTSDEDALSGANRINNQLPDGGHGFTYTIDLSANEAQVVMEHSTDLQNWSSNPTSFDLVSRTHNGNGTETFAWRPSSLPERLFIRLKVSL